MGKSKLAFMDNTILRQSIDFTMESNDFVKSFCFLHRFLHHLFLLNAFAIIGEGDHTRS